MKLDLFAERIIDDRIKFMVTAFFTETYQHKAIRLQESLNEVGLSYRLYKTNQIHQSISLKGESEALDYTKPRFLSAVCQELQNQSLPRKREFTHILYMDCDVVFIPNLEKINYLQNLCDRNIDFAICNWLGDQEACAGYVQPRNETGQKAEVWTIAYREQIGYHLEYLLCSGCTQLYSRSPKARLIWETWQHQLEQYEIAPTSGQQFPGDDHFLDFVWNNYLRGDRSIKFSWLPKAYSRCQWWLWVEPLIDHPEIVSSHPGYLKNKQPELPCNRTTPPATITGKLITQKAEGVFYKLLELENLDVIKMERLAKTTLDSESQGIAILNEAKELLALGEYEQAIAKVREAIGYSQSDAVKAKLVSLFLPEPSNIVRNTEISRGFGGQSSLKNDKSRSKKQKSQTSKNMALDLEQLMSIALEFHRQRQFEQALDGYQQLLRLEPNHGDALANMGTVLKCLGREDEAIGCYYRVLELKPDSAETWFNLGNSLHTIGELEEAITAYQNAVKYKPNLGGAYFKLGKLRQEQEKFREASEFYRQAIVLMPSFVQSYTNLGNVFKALGDLEGAIAQHQQAIQIQPEYAEAYYNLGNALNAKLDYEGAKIAYQKALQLNPQFVQAWLNLGNVGQELGEFLEAESAFNNAIALQPLSPQAYICLADLQRKKGNSTAGITTLQTALQQLPDHEDIASKLALALQAQDLYSEAIATLQNFLELHPYSATIHCNLGSLYTDIGNGKAALFHLQRAIQLEPTLAIAQCNLGYAFINGGQITEAIDCLQQAIAIDPTMTNAHLNLGYAFINQGRVEEGISCFRNTLAIAPDSHPANSNLLYALNYESNPNCEAIAKAHFDWGQSFKIELEPKPRKRIKSKSDCLRIGYLSPDFRQHSVAYFIEPILKYHDRTKVEIYAYAHVSQPDEVTDRLRYLVDFWREIHLLDDDQLFAQIQADNLDILVDLAGHTGQNRLPVFARKPAPIQITYIGYPNTTGLSAMDYRFTDVIADPLGNSDRYYAEELIRLPNCFLCYQPSANLPPVSNLPAKTLGFISFGSCNNLSKLTSEVIALWCQILHAVPNSRLILKVRWFDDAQTRDRYLALFASHDIDQQRIELVGLIIDPMQHLAYYSNIDIALDTFPYNGTTTTCEALVMGVPTITLSSYTHASRVGNSLLTTVGLSDWVATSEGEYLDKVIAFASDLDKLACLRIQLREQVLNSPLCDAIVHTQNLEKIYSHLLNHESRLS